MKRKWLWLIAIGLAVLIAGIILCFTLFSHDSEADALAQQILQYRQAKFQLYAQENDRYEDYQVDVAFLGDSLTDLYDLQLYYPQYVTANRGIGGDTSFQLQERLELSVYQLKPKVVVMLIGANNVDTMLENYEEILQGLQENLPESQVVLLSMTAMGGEYWGSKNAQAIENNKVIQQLAAQYGFTFVDLFTPLFDPSIGEVYEGYTTDGGHFTPTGYEVVTAQITPVLEQLLP